MALAFKNPYDSSTFDNQAVSRYHSSDFRIAFLRTHFYAA